MSQLCRNGSNSKGGRGPTAHHASKRGRSFINYPRPLFRFLGDQESTELAECTSRGKTIHPDESSLERKTRSISPSDRCMTWPLCCGMILTMPQRTVCVKHFRHPAFIGPLGRLSRRLNNLFYLAILFQQSKTSPDIVRRYFQRSSGQSKK